MTIYADFKIGTYDLLKYDYQASIGYRFGKLINALTARITVVGMRAMRK